jgi:hypothetical protein
VIPGFSDEYIVNSIAHATELKAIVLELYGTGNLPSRKVREAVCDCPVSVSFRNEHFVDVQASLLTALEAAVKKGIAVVASSQCLRGTVELRAYELGRRLADIGVISGHDMTTEAISCKLAYLLSWPGMTLSQLRFYMGKSLRGEITEVAATEHAHAADGVVLLTMNDISGAARRASGTSADLASTDAARRLSLCSASRGDGAASCSGESKGVGAAAGARSVAVDQSQHLLSPTSTSGESHTAAGVAAQLSASGAKGRAGDGGDFAANATNFSSSPPGALLSPGRVVPQPMHLGDESGSGSTSGAVRNGGASPHFSKLLLPQFGSSYRALPLT